MHFHGHLTGLLVKQLKTWIYSTNINIIHSLIISEYFANGKKIDWISFAFITSLAEAFQQELKMDPGQNISVEKLIDATENKLLIELKCWKQNVKSFK